MANETSSVRLATVFLRATLAVIFIWHGLDKLASPLSALGAAWAQRLWQQNNEAPPEVLAKLENLPPRSWLTDDEANAKLSDEKVKELAGLRFKTAQDQLRRGYAAGAVELPAMFSPAVQYAVAWGELLGGIALLIGLLTRAAAFGLILIQLGAIYFVTGPMGLAPTRGVGFEYNLCLVAMCLVVIILGPGGWSVDHFLHWGRNTAAQQQAASTTAGVAS